MIVGLFTVGRSMVTELRQELRLPDVPADPELASAAQAQIASLAQRRGLRVPAVTVVSILGRPQSADRADVVGTGGLAVIRLHRRRRQATVLLAAAAASLSAPAREILLAHELAHFERYYSSWRVQAMFYAWPACSIAVAGAALWAAVAISTSVAFGLAGLLGLLLLTAYAATSRREETAADLYAIDLTGDPEAAAELMDVYVQDRAATRRRGRLRAFVEDRLGPPIRSPQYVWRPCASGSPHSEQLGPVRSYCPGRDACRSGCPGPHEEVPGAHSRRPSTASRFVSRARLSYRLVVRGSACPAIAWAVARPVPLSSRSPITVRRRSCGFTGSATPAWSLRRSRRSTIVCGVRGRCSIFPPLRSGQNSGPGLPPAAVATRAARGARPRRPGRPVPCCPSRPGGLIGSLWSRRPG